MKILLCVNGQKSSQIYILERETSPTGAERNVCGRRGAATVTAEV